MLPRKGRALWNSHTIVTLVFFFVAQVYEFCCRNILILLRQLYNENKIPSICCEFGERSFVPLYFVCLLSLLFYSKKRLPSYFWQMDETSVLIEETFHRLRARPGVSAVVLLNQEGQQIKTSMGSGPTADRYGSVISRLVNAIRLSVNALENDPASVCLRYVTFRYLSVDRRASHYIQVSVMTELLCIFRLSGLSVPRSLHFRTNLSLSFELELWQKSFSSSLAVDSYLRSFKLQKMELIIPHTLFLL